MKPSRLISALLIAAAIQCAAGCAAWQARNWDLSHLRDPRAVDLEDRLTKRRPPSTASASDAADAQGEDAERSAG